MNEVVHVSDPRELAHLIREDQERLQQDVKYGIIAAANIGQRVIRSVEPIDTGSLRRETIVREFPRGFNAALVAEIAATSPHAAAQEVGTRPFTPPFGPILAWATRQAPNMGMPAGRATENQLRRALKSAIRTNVRNERRFARLSGRKRMSASNAAFLQNASLTLGASRDGINKASRDQQKSPVYQLARRVWASIRKKGIKAKWFMRDAQPKLQKILARCVAKAVREHRPAASR